MRLNDFWVASGSLFLSILVGLSRPFFALAVPILGFVFYLGGSAIMKGFKAKVDNRPVKPDEKEENEIQVSPTNSNDLSGEISK